VPDGRLLASLPPSTNLACYSVLWSPDGRHLAANRDYDRNGFRSDIEVWDLQGAPRRVLLIRDTLYKGRAFHPTKPHFISGSAGKVAGVDGVMTAWDLETGRSLAQARFEASARELVFSADGRFTAASYQRTDGWGVSVHRATDGAMVCSNVLASRVVSLAWAPTGRMLALSDDGGVIHLMDARTGSLRVLGRHNAEAVSTTFDAEGRYLITGAWGRELACWDVQRRERAFAINVESYVAQFRADGLACATLTDAGVQLYAFERPLIQQEMEEELSPRARHARFSPDGRWLAACGDQRFALWDLSSGGPGAMADYAGEARPFWAPNGELFGSRSRVEDVFRWRPVPASNPASPPVLERLPVFKPARFSSVSVHSNQLAWTCAQGSSLSDLADATNRVEGWISTIRGVNGVSPDGRWLAIYGPFTANLAVYRLPGLEPVAHLTAKARISGFSFSPRGDELAVTSNGQVEFWSTETWEPTRVGTNFIGMPGAGVLFGPDGRSVWLARSLRSAGLFDAATLQLRLPLPTGLLPLALSPDGQRLAVSVEGRRLQILDVPALRRELARLGLDWQD
jgi:WD40 repeat protein